MDKMWYRQKRELLIRLKRNEIRTHATIWINLEGTVLSKLEQADKYLNDSVFVRSLE